METHTRSLRIPDEIWAQVLAMTAYLNTVGAVALHGRVYPSTVVRLALLEGLRALERRHGKPDGG